MKDELQKLKGQMMYVREQLYLLSNQEIALSNQIFILEQIISKQPIIPTKTAPIKKGKKF